MPSPAHPTERPQTTIRTLTLALNGGLLLTGFLALIGSSIVAAKLTNSTYNAPDPTDPNKTITYPVSGAWRFFGGPFLPVMTILHSGLGVFLIHFKDRLTTRPSHILVRLIISLIYLVFWAFQLAGWMQCAYFVDEGGWATCTTEQIDVRFWIPETIFGFGATILYFISIPLLGFAIHNARKQKKLMKAAQAEEKAELTQLRSLPRSNEGLEPVRLPAVGYREI